MACFASVLLRGGSKAGNVKNTKSCPTSACPDRKEAWLSWCQLVCWGATCSLHKGWTQWQGEVGNAFPKLARPWLHFLLSQQLWLYLIHKLCIFPHTGYLLYVPCPNRNIKSNNGVGVHPSVLEVPKLIHLAKGQLPDCCILLIYFLSCTTTLVPWPSFRTMLTSFISVSRSWFFPS